MSLHFKLSFKRVKINRESEVLVGDMVTGVSRVNLYDIHFGWWPAIWNAGNMFVAPEATGERSVSGIQTEPYYYFLKRYR